MTLFVMMYFDEFKFSRKLKSFYRWCLQILIQFTTNNLLKILSFALNKFLKKRTSLRKIIIFLCFFPDEIPVINTENKLKQNFNSLLYLTVYVIQIHQRGIKRSCDSVYGNPINQDSNSGIFINFGSDSGSSESKIFIITILVNENILICKIFKTKRLVCIISNSYAPVRDS